MSAFTLTLTVDDHVGGLWYWHLRCWDSDVHQHETLITGAVKSCLDPQVALGQALEDCAAEVQRLVNARWVLMT